MRLHGHIWTRDIAAVNAHTHAWAPQRTNTGGHMIGRPQHSLSQWHNPDNVYLYSCQIRMRANWFPYSTGMAMWCTYEYGHRWYSIWVRVAENGISRIYDWVLLKAKFPIFSDSGQNSIIYSWKFDIKELRPHLYFGWTVYYFMPKAVFHPLPSPLCSWKRIIKKL